MKKIIYVLACLLTFISLMIPFKAEAAVDSMKISLTVDFRTDGDDTFVSGASIDQLSSDNGIMVLPEKKSVEVRGNGRAAFGEMIFTKAGNYEYRVIQTGQGKDGAELDTAAYKVLISVVYDESENLRAPVVVTRNDQDQKVDDISFRNVIRKNEPEKTVSAKLDEVNTGDRSGLRPWIFVLIAPLLLVVIVLLKNRGKDEDEKL